MRGELIEVWGETWREIWSPLLENEDYDDDLLMDFYRKLVPMPPVPEEPDARELQYNADGEMTAKSRSIIEQYDIERAEFNRLRAEHEEFATGTRDLRVEIRNFIKSEIKTEKAACEVLRAVSKIVINIGDESYTNRYFTLVEKFLKKFSLRYDLRRPFHLCPTLPGMFSTLIKELRRIADNNDHLREMMNEFEDAIRDLNIGPTPTRIKSVISKQMNLIEAIGGKHPNANQRPRRNTLGAIAEDVETWPHEQLMTSLKELYGFTCDYPGIRHGGTPANRIRDVEIKDVVAACVLITGFVPYLTDQIDSSHVFTAQ